MDECCEGMGNWHLTSQVSFYVPPRPPSWHVQIQRQTCQPLEIVSGQSALNWCFPVCPVCIKKETQTIAALLKGSCFKVPLHSQASKLQEEALIVVTHDTWAHSESRKRHQFFFDMKTCLFDYRSLQNEHMSSSNKIWYMCHCVKLWTNVSSCLCSSQALCSTNVGHMLSRTKVHMYRRRGWNGRNHSIKLRRPQVDPPRLNTDLSWAQAMLRNGKLCHWDFKK